MVYDILGYCKNISIEGEKAPFQEFANELIDLYAKTKEKPVVYDLFKKKINK